MRVKVVITEIRPEEIQPPAEYKVLADTGGKDGGSEYGYVTPPKRVELRETEIFKQVVEIEDIKPIIGAINGLVCYEPMRASAEEIKRLFSERP